MKHVKFKSITGARLEAVITMLTQFQAVRRALRFTPVVPNISQYKDLFFTSDNFADPHMLTAAPFGSVNCENARF